jgi:hypothetical protein
MHQWFGRVVPLFVVFPVAIPAQAVIRTAESELQPPRRSSFRNRVTGRQLLSAGGRQHCGKQGAFFMKPCW